MILLYIILIPIVSYGVLSIITSLMDFSIKRQEKMKINNVKDKYNNFKAKYDKEVEYLEKNKAIKYSNEYLLLDTKEIRILTIERGISYYAEFDVPENLDLIVRNIDQIKYYQVEGSKRTEMYIEGGEGGGSSISGAVVGKIIAGNTGAIIGSRKENNPVTTTYKKIDDRKVIVKFYDGVEKSLDYLAYEYLLSKIPEKDYDNYILNMKLKGQIN